MALHYQTEYRLGNRGRICRSYTGFEALLAIFFDLIFGLLFEMVSMAIRLTARIFLLAVQIAVQVFQATWKFLVAVMTVLVYLVTLPFALIHEAVDQLRYGVGSGRDSPSRRPASAGKQEWALGREV